VRSTSAHDGQCAPLRRTCFENRSARLRTAVLPLASAWTAARRPSRKLQRRVYRHQLGSLRLRRLRRLLRLGSCILATPAPASATAPRPTPSVAWTASTPPATRSLRELRAVVRHPGRHPRDGLLGRPLLLWCHGPGTLCPDGACVLLSTDPQNCGECGNVCVDPAQDASTGGALQDDSYASPRLR